jgi:hypothetical protein
LHDSVVCYVFLESFFQTEYVDVGLHGRIFAELWNVCEHPEYFCHYFSNRISQYVIYERLVDAENLGVYAYQIDNYYFDIISHAFINVEMVLEFHRNFISTGLLIGGEQSLKSYLPM